MSGTFAPSSSSKALTSPGKGDQLITEKASSSSRRLPRLQRVTSHAKILSKVHSPGSVVPAHPPLRPMSSQLTSRPSSTSTESYSFDPLTPLMCCCCLDSIEVPVGTCSTCGDDNTGPASALPLCSKCSSRHQQPDSYKKLRGHKFRVLSAPTAEPLQLLGIETLGSDLCSRHAGEQLRYFCRHSGCGFAVCVKCVSAHPGHVLEELTVAHSQLCAALLSRIFNSSCWPAESLLRQAKEDDATASLFQHSDHALAEDELLDRLDYNSAARRSLADELASASRAAAEAFDEATAVLNSALQVGHHYSGCTQQ
jgi:hypothetical protein